MGMGEAHVAAYWSAFALAVVAMLGRMSRRVHGRAVDGLTICFIAVMALSAALRWRVTGHPPIFGTFENTIASSWVLALMALLLRARQRPASLGFSDGWMLFLVVVTLAYGLFFDRTPYPLTISERSVLVDIHVVFAWSAYAALVAAGAAAVELLRERGQVAALERTLTRGLGLGFVALTLMMVVGSAYSYLLFADWYRWEIVGTSTLVAWLGCASVLHGRLMHGLRGKKLAAAALALVPVVLFVFWSWSLVAVTYHHFEIPAIQAW